MSSAKNAFFPWPVVQHEGHFSFLKRKPFSGPDSEIRGKTSSSSLKNVSPLATLWTGVLEKKGFYSKAPALYQGFKVKMTFASLDEISTRMAKGLGKILKEAKAKPNPDGDTVVAFLLPEVESPSESVIVLIFAILKLGLTLLPISPGIHLNDLSWAVKLMKPALVLTAGPEESSPEVAGLLESLRMTPGGTPGFVVKVFEDLWNSVVAGNSSLDEESLSESLQELGTLDAEDWGDLPPEERTVGIYFTAGSVSTPHAVRIGTGEILNRIHWQSKTFPTLPSDAFALSSALSDVRSLVQILTPLLSGKPLNLLSKEDVTSPGNLVERVAAMKLTRLTLTPPEFEGLVAHVAENPGVKGKLGSITHLFVSGGRLKVETGRRFFTLFSGVYKSGLFLVAMYGMVETGGEASYEVFFNGADLEKKMAPLLGTLSVGTPMLNSNIAIVDRFDKLVPLGARGEVVISGACLSSGGYVSGGRGQGQSKGQSGKGQGRTSSAASKQHIHFRTGDIGRIIQESGGPRRLFIEGRFDNESLTAGGETINLKQWRGQVLATAMVEDAAVLTYHRGRDVQVTVAAVVLKEDKTCIQVLEKIHEKINGKGGGGYVVRGPLPTVFALEEVPHLRDGRVDKKAIRGLFRKILLECDPQEWQGLALGAEDKVPAQFVCKAIALSTGLPLALVIRRFGKSFSELGGTPLNAVIVVKMCRDYGYPIKMKDFISARSVRELTGVLKRSKVVQIQTLPIAEDVDVEENVKGQGHGNDFDGKFTFEAMSPDDTPQIILFLKNDTPPHVQTHPQDIIKYWRGVVDSVRPLGMSVVAKLNRAIVGLALTGGTQFKVGSSKPPKDISYGLELLESCLSVSKYQMWRNSSGRIARCHFLGVSSTNSNLSPGEKAVLIEELLERSCRLAKMCHYASLVISTANPVIQETGIHLCKFVPLLEFPASRFKSRDGSRPFSYVDDNHTASVLIKGFGGGMARMEEDERDSIISINTSKTGSFAHKLDSDRELDGPSSLAETTSISGSERSGSVHTTDKSEDEASNDNVASVSRLPVK